MKNFKVLVIFSLLLMTAPSVWAISKMLAKDVTLVTTSFNKNLTGAENTVQKAMDFIDNIHLHTPAGFDGYVQFKCGAYFCGDNGFVYDPSSGLLYVAANFELDGNLDVNGSLEVQGNTYVNGQVDINGDINLEGLLRTDAQLIRGDSNVEGNHSVEGNVIVLGGKLILPVSTSGAIPIGDGTGYNGHVISGDLSVSLTGVALVGGIALPGSSKYYGTDNFGTKGYHDLPSDADFQAHDTDLDDLADGSLTGSKVGFEDPDSNFAAITLQTAIAELDNTNASGINATDGKVHWTQLVGVPAGLADGTDDGTGGGSSTVAGETYLSASGSVITAAPVNLSGTHVTGTLPKAKLPTNLFPTSIQLSLSGTLGLSVGSKGMRTIPFNGTITGWVIQSESACSVVVDVWKDTYANSPPVVGDTIAGSEKPTLTASAKNQDLTLTTWTTSVSAGDVVRFNVDSCNCTDPTNLSVLMERT